ncbi:hypothetical protein EVG20_g11668, partial [Dentipellis fragilis]
RPQRRRPTDNSQAAASSDTDDNDMYMTCAVPPSPVFTLGPNGLPVGFHPNFLYALKKAKDLKGTDFNIKYPPLFTLTNDVYKRVRDDTHSGCKRINSLIMRKAISEDYDTKFAEGEFDELRSPPRAKPVSNYLPADNAAMLRELPFGMSTRNSSRHASRASSVLADTEPDQSPSPVASLRGPSPVASVPEYSQAASVPPSSPAATSIGEPGYQSGTGEGEQEPDLEDSDGRASEQDESPGSAVRSDDDEDRGGPQASGSLAQEQDEESDPESASETDSDDNRPLEAPRGSPSLTVAQEQVEQPEPASDADTDDDKPLEAPRGSGSQSPMAQDAEPEPAPAGAAEPSAKNSRKGRPSLDINPKKKRRVGSLGGPGDA